MTNVLQPGFPQKVRVTQVLLFVVMLAPVSLTVADDKVSANYLFVCLLLSPLGFRHNYLATAYIAFMVVSFMVGVAMFSQFEPDFIIRQATSFFLALIAVLLLFVNLSVRLEELFLAIVLCAVAYSCCAIYMFGAGGFSLADIYLVKGGLREFITDWPQRYVIVLIFAFFIAIRRFASSILWQCAVVPIVTCIFLTFTRAAWLATVAGLIVYFPLKKFIDRREAHHAGKKRYLVVYLGIAGLATLLVFAIRNPEIVSAAGTLTTNFFAVVQTNPDEASANGSEGERLALYSSIIETIKANPLTGTGFAGAYLVIEGEGSAHGQYMDALLRTGVLGLIFYLFLWVKVLSAYWRTRPEVVAGLIAWFVFGFFHETTKLSYGALIFFVLLNKAYEPQLNSHIYRCRWVSLGRNPSCAA